MIVQSRSLYGMPNDAIRGMFIFIPVGYRLLVAIGREF